MSSEFREIARSHIVDLPVYVPGMDVEDVKREYGVSRVIKLASNENPLGPSPLAVEAVRSSLERVSRYPDGSCGELRKRLADKLGIQPESLFFGNGTDEIIDFVFFAFFDPGDVAVMGDPTFSSYFLSGMTIGASMSYVPLEEHSHHVERMLDAVDERTKAVFVGSPHNPTGTICTEEEMRQILDGLPDNVLLVWDEAYGEYVEDPRYPQSVRYLQANRNLVVLRTFSKIYGLAGLRIGYAIADPQVVTLLEKVRPPFNVNSLAQVAAMAAIDDQEHLVRSREINARGKEYLSEELARLGMKPVPTQANFVLFKYQGVIDNLTERLLEEGIIVRDGKPLGYPGYLRMTIGTPEQNREVIETVERLLNS